MHPSWRDMVIDFLVEHKDARQEFLLTCGVHGLLLALSTGGGKLGMRTFPLLLEPDDWSLFAEAASRLIRNGTTIEIRALLKATLDALRLETRRKKGGLARPPLRDVAEHVLQACKLKWATDGWAIQSTDLSAYYQISEFLSPLPPSPDLSESWQRHWDAARSQMEEFDEDDSDVLVGDIDEWLDLCGLIWRYEPRFGRQIGLPEAFGNLLREFVPKLRPRAEWAPQFDTIDECDRELEELDVIQDLCSKIGRVFTELKESAGAIAATAENSQDEVRIQKSILEESVQDESTDYVQEDEDEIEATISDTNRTTRAKTVFLTSAPTAELSIDQLFEDL